MRARGMGLFTVALVASMGAGILAGMAIERTEVRPTEEITFMPSDPAVTVTRHEGATHLVTRDGVLIIVPTDQAQCVMVALPSAEYAECVPAQVEDTP